VLQPQLLLRCSRREVTPCAGESSPRARRKQTSSHPSKDLGSSPCGVTLTWGQAVLAPTTTHMHGATGRAPDPTVAPAPPEGARAPRRSMQCQVSGREQRAGPGAVPSRPVGTHAVTPGGWRALTAGRHRNARADSPVNEHSPVTRTAASGASPLLQPPLQLGFLYQKPRLKAKRGEGRSLQRRWAALDYLTALQRPPRLRCGRGQLNLLLHHHHLPPHALRCLHGTRPALSPGEGSSELAALFANEEGRESGDGRVTQQGDRVETKIQHPGKRKEKKQQKSRDEGGWISGSPAHTGLQHRNFPLLASQAEAEGRKLSGSQVAPSNFAAPTKN